VQELERMRRVAASAASSGPVKAATRAGSVAAEYLGVGDSVEGLRRRVAAAVQPAGQPTSQMAAPGTIAADSRF
jgi:hypothetical protein